MRGGSLNIRRATASTVCRPQHFKTPRISFTTLYLLLVFLQEILILACCNFEPIQHHQYGRLFFTGASMKRLQPETPTTAFDVSVHDLGTDAIWSSLAWGMLPKKVLKRKWKGSEHFQRVRSLQNHGQASHVTWSQRAVWGCGNSNGSV